MYVEEDGWYLKTHDLNPDKYVFSFGCDYGSQVKIYPIDKLWNFVIFYADGEYTLKEAEGYPSLEEAKDAALQFYLHVEEKRYRRLKDKLRDIGLEGIIE